MVGDPFPGKTFDVAPPDDGIETVPFPDFGQIIALDSAGHVLRPTTYTTRGDTGEVTADPVGRELLAFLPRSRCSHGTFSVFAKELFAVDSQGLISLGTVHLGPLWVPCCTGEWSNAGHCKPEEVTRLLRSGRESDAHRALRLLEDVPTSLAELALPLLDSSDGFLGARAVAVLGGHGLLRPLLERFAADPDPRVRIASICPLSERSERRPILEALARDSDPRVASAARARIARIDESDKSQPVLAPPEEN